MKKIWILTIGMLALGMDAYIVAGLLPEMSKSFNKSSSEIGQGVTVFTLLFAISAPLFSILLAKRQVKHILIIAISIFALANLITAFSPNYPIYIFSRSIAGLGAGVFSPIAISSSSQLVSSSHKGKAVAFTIAGMSIGTVIGVPLGLEISKIASWRITMLIIVLISILALISILIYMPTFKVQAPPDLKYRFKLFNNKNVIRIVSVTLCASIASFGLYTYLADIIKANGNFENLVFYLSAWDIGGLIGSLSIGYVIDKFKNTRLLMFIILLTLIISFVLIIIVIKIPILSFLPFILWGAMGWSTQAPQQYILLHNYKEHGSAAVALNSSINYLGSAIGSAIGGLILFTANNVLYLIYGAILIAFIGVIIQTINILNTKSNNSS